MQAVMPRSARAWRNQSASFRGVYVESALSATRKNILAPGSVGVYSGGSNYNPAQVMRDESVRTLTEKIDKKLEGVPNKGVVELSIKEIQELIGWTRPDQTQHEISMR